MYSTTVSVLLLVCLSVLFISGARQINAEPDGGSAIWSTIRSDEAIPPESLIPRSRVKRVKRDAFDGAFDQRRDPENDRERVKQRFPVWNDAEGEPQLNFD